MTTEIERIKILEGKVGQVIEHVHKLAAENEKLKQQIKELKAEKKEHEDQARRVSQMSEELKKLEGERDAIKEKIEGLINQINQLGL